MKSGLVSVTFRQLDPREIVGLAAKAGLEGIEWSSGHLPLGEAQQTQEKLAKEIRAMTVDAGLAVAAYGSACRVGEGEADTFEATVLTAAELGAPLIRVWAGRKGSADADETHWERAVADSRRLADLAHQAGITVAYEYHQNTLTDTRAAARRLLTEVAHANVRTLWQPPPWPVEEIVAGLDDVTPWLANVHVFHWSYTDEGRRPLAEGRERWLRYLRVACNGAGNGDGQRYALLEFVRDDDPGSLRRDADTLRGWLAEIEGGAA